jgi:hypothetical protein
MLKTSFRLIFALLACSIGRAAEPPLAVTTIGDNAFVVGLNGHPLLAPVYRDIGVARQIELLKQLHAGIYRFDLPVYHFDGSPPPDLKALDDLVDRLNQNGIAPLPILFPPGDRSKTLSPAETEKLAYDYVTKLAPRYKGRIHYWELSNELDNFSILRPGDTWGPGGKPVTGGPPSGWPPNHYDEQRYQVALGTLRGLSRGLRSVDPGARLIVNTCGWVHVGFVDRLVKDNLDFDILSWHWYSEDKQIQNAGGLPLLQHLLSYNKPLWITEGNFRPTKKPNEEQLQSDYLKGILSDMDELYPSVRAYAVYELLDEPDMKAGEQRYGLVHVQKGPDGKWMAGQPKPSFEMLRNFAP